MSYEPNWAWKQRIAVTRFLIAFRVRRVLRSIHVRYGLAANPLPRQPRHRDYWSAKR